MTKRHMLRLAEAAGEVIEALRGIPNPVDMLLVCELAAATLRERMRREGEPSTEELEKEALAWLKDELDIRDAMLLAAPKPKSEAS